MFNAALRTVRPILFFESTALVMLFYGVVFGLILVFRKSTSAPLYWTLFLVSLVALATLDLTATLRLGAQFQTRVGGDFAKTVQSRFSARALVNVLLMIHGVVWSVYWLRSKRVRVRFAPHHGTPRDSSDLPGSG